ncbi:MAG TPA: PAS domain S-box protein [Candidatus Rifleibacterium sp.]|nr:PAS domain S-box protein [Candidatus Rifleibacterium sp.]
MTDKINTFRADAVKQRELESDPARRYGNRWMRWLYMLLVAVIFAMVAPGFAEPVLLTSEEQEWLIKNPDKLTLWYNDSFPPLEFADPDDRSFIGLGADITALVEQRLGVKFHRKISNDWNEHLKALESGVCAIAPTIVENNERLKFAFFSTSYAKVPAVIIASPNLGSNITLKKLAGRKIAVVAGFVTETYLRNFKEASFKIQTVSNVSEGLQAVAFGQVDAYVENLAVASYYISQHGISNLKVVGTTDYSFVFSMAVSRKFPLLFSALQKAMQSITPAEHAAFRNRWITLRIDQGMSPATIFLIQIAVLFFSTLILCLTVISILLKRNLNDKISRLQAAQIESAENESRFRSLFTQAPVALVELDADNRMIGMNQCFIDTFGYTVEDLPDTDAWWPLAYPDPQIREQARTTWFKALQNARTSSNNTILPQEYTIACKNGRKITLMIGASIIGDRTMVTFFNISEIKKMQKELLASLQRFETLFESAPYPCAISDMSDRCLMANQHFCLLTGKAAGEIIGSNISEVGLDLLPQFFAHLHENILKTGYHSEEITTEIRGEKRHLILVSKLLELDSQPAILSSTIDISKRRYAEEALKQNEENLRVTLNSIADAVIATDMRGNITRINPAACNMTAWSPDEAIGRPLGEVFHIADANSHASLEGLTAEFLNTGEMAGTCTDTLLLARDSKEHLINHSGTTIRNDAGTAIGMVLIFRDVTEEHTLQEQLRHSQKMDAIGKLAGGIAHDFNNMLGGIIGAAELLGLTVQKTSPEGKYLKVILDASERAAQLTSKLLAFARRQPVISSPLNLLDPLNEAIDLLQRTVDRRVRIEKIFSAETLNVNGDFSQLQSAFLNLLINASQAMSEGGTIFVSSKAVDLDAYYCEASPFTLKPGQFAEIEIRDTGYGIPKENLQRIFEPFFTTKAQGKGTGLGLAAVFGTMQQHDGAINVYSEVGIGTCVHVLVPLLQNATLVEVSEPPQPLRGSGRILIIDDEPMMRIIAGGILEDLGYEVLTAENGRQGLEVFKQSDKSISLVILDMIMPEMNGRECFFELKKIAPDLRLIISSGFTRDEDLEKMKAAGAGWFIRKPFRIADLSQIVHEAMTS